MDSDLSRGRDGTLFGPRGVFVVSALSALSLWNSFAVVRELILDAFPFPTKGGEENLERFFTLCISPVASSAGCDDVDDRAKCFAKLQLCIDFRYLEKNNLQIFLNSARKRATESAGEGIGGSVSLCEREEFI